MIDNIGIIASQRSITPFSFGNALKTTSGTEFVSFSSGLNSLNNAVTASLHCKLNVASGQTSAFGATLDGNNRFGILVYNNIIYCFNANGGAGYGSASFLSYAGQEVFASLVLNGGLTGNDNRMTLILNDVDIPLTYNGTIASSVFSTAGSNFYINKHNSLFGKANYDELVVTTDASTTLQVAAWRNGGDGAYPQECFTNILDYWNCNQDDGETVLNSALDNADGTLNNFVEPYFI